MRFSPSYCPKSCTSSSARATRPTAGPSSSRRVCNRPPPGENPADGRRQMPDEKKQSKDERDVEAEELEEQEGEELPAREVMSIVDPSGAPTGGLGPPVL